MNVYSMPRGSTSLKKKYPPCRSRMSISSILLAYQRHLNGVDDVLHWKRNHEKTPVYDLESDSIVGYVNFFTLKFSQYAKKENDISTHWHMVEVESLQGDGFHTMCKIRVEDNDLKIARANVAKFEKKIRGAEVKAAIDRAKLKVLVLLVENENAKAVVQARESLLAAEVSVKAAMEFIKVSNDNHYQRIVEARRIAAAVAAPAPAGVDIVEHAGWAGDVVEQFQQHVNNEAAAAKWEGLDPSGTAILEKENTDAADDHVSVDED